LAEPILLLELPTLLLLLLLLPTDSRLEVVCRLQVSIDLVQLGALRRVLLGKLYTGSVQL